MRRKSYPLELQIRGAGLVFVQVDNGREEMAFDGTLIRAKQQIHLKLETQYSQASFVLNGSAYSPAWQIYNRNVGTLSTFDHAEALITSDSQQPVNVLGQHKVGETYSEWLLFVGIDQKNLCKQNKLACKALSSIEKSGNGVFYTYDSSGTTIAWTFADHKIVGIMPK
jgi:YD repeat-containing protein